MNIVVYPHPTLRHVSKPIKRVDAKLRQIVRDMFELMYEARGVGLAANQVDLPLRLFVMNAAGNRDEGEELAFFNPVISGRQGAAEQEEGCLSLPDVHGDVKRPEKIRLTAYDITGKEFQAELSGLMARIVQHETDHLDGILFFDRMPTTAQMDLKPALDEFELDFDHRRQRSEIPTDAEISARLTDLERTYC